jgi:drug/metabolite transporter (DMT)-like permease
MAAVALGLASSLAWGLADFFGGLQSRKRPLLAVLVATQTAGLALMLVVAGARGEGLPAAGAWLAWAVGGSLLGVAGLAAFYRGLATGNMGVVAPISSTAAVVPFVVGLAMGERPSTLQAVGVAIAIAGVALASLEHGDPAANARTGRLATGAGLAIVAAVGFGGFFVATDQASEVDPIWAILVARAASASVLWAMLLATRTKLAPGRAVPALAVIGILDTGANLLYALASTQGLVSIVAVLASVYPVITVILARIVLGERLHALQRVGAVGALAGAALISVG